MVLCFGLSLFAGSPSKVEDSVALRVNPTLKIQGRTHRSKKRCCGIAMKADILPTSAAADSLSISSNTALRDSVLLSLSFAVNYVILAGSMLFKLPQVIRIVKNGNANGISALSYIMETIGLALSTVYSMRNRFPFGTYGECALIVIQNFVILGLILRDKNYSLRKQILYLILSVISILSIGILLSPRIPSEAAVFAQVCSVPLLNASRIPQLALVYRTKSTGQLSLVTLLLQVAGNIARLFTTAMQLAGNPVVIFSTVAALTLNTALVVQYFFYASPGIKIQ
mmetsp:Transcript_12447/g.22484  ORF Transcript_12447/g.22484 Transcript_12447/m.22484 type:complete len:283 (+) Transcript_12447:2164-3012(+)